MLLDLSHGIVLLLTFCWLQSFVVNRLKFRQSFKQLVSGFLFGGICVIGMMAPITLSSGLIIDERSVILGLSGIFSGPICAAIAALIAGWYHFFVVGGVGAFAGTVLTAISALFGVAFYYGRKRNWVKVGPWQLLAFGFVLHTTVMLSAIVLLNSLAQKQMISIAIVFVTAFSFATMLIGLLLQDAENRYSTAQALSQSESHQRSIFNAIPDLLFMLDEDGRYVEVLTSSKELLFDDPAKIIGVPIHDILPKNIAVPAVKAIHQTVKTQRPHTFEYERQTQKGIRQFEARTQPNETIIDGKRTVVVLVRDISERHQHHIHEQRLLKTQRALSEINEAIMRLENESELFPLACRIAVEHGAAFVAWVGVKEESGERIVPIAWHGRGEKYFKNMAHSSNPDLPEGQGPVGIVYREKHSVIINDYSKDDRMTLWHDNARQVGIRSGALFPILRNSTPFAVFVANSDQINAFDDDTVALLEQMARSISFALDNFDRETLRLQGEIDLRTSESRFRQIVHEAPFPMLIHTEKGEILLINDAWTKLTGYKKRDLSKRTRTAIKKLFRNQASNALENFRKLLADQRHISDEYTIYRKDGTERICFFESSLLGTFANGSKAMISMAVDVTEHRLAEKALKLTQFSVDQASFPIMWTTNDGRFHFVNDAACRLYGYSKEEFATLSAPDINKTYSKVQWSDSWRELKEKKFMQFEATNVTKQGDEIDVQINANFLEYDGQEYNCAFISNITEKKKAEELIWHQANFDSLTGLPNRRMFINRLEQEICQSSRTGLPTALLYIDLDDFKDVNDSYGHDTGDALLQKVAQRLKECVRKTDTIARLGGDEFTVTMGKLHTRAPVERVCQQILESLSKPFNLRGESVYISASIGITLYPDDAKSIEELLINADQAMYASKHQGRHRYHYFTPSMQKAAQNRKQLIKHLRNAIDDNLLYVMYQPIIELSTGKMRKAEALVRWQHPKLGMVSPSEFIPVAEETGMIYELGAKVFETAANQASIWRKSHSPDFQISVNISPLQFKNPTENSKAWLEFMSSTQKEGASVVAEITEGLLLDAGENVTNQLLAFRDAGIQVAIDDFGTGYSSLSYLKKFDIDYIKIDKAFVTGLAPESEDLALCEAIIVMAHKLNISVIAEGVETTQQRDLLTQAGCDFAQGYLFSHPLSAEALEKMF